VESREFAKDTVEVNYLEWGVLKPCPLLSPDHSTDQAFPEPTHKHSFDLIVASDVVYIPECLQPLLDSFKHFLKPCSGRVLMVNNKIRQDLFTDRYYSMIEQAGLQIEHEGTLDEGSDKFKMFIFSSQK
jgi:hypothetical protein